MSRRLSIASAIIIFASIAAISGCSGHSNSTLVPLSGATGIQKPLLSMGTWTTKAPMPTARANLGAGVVNNILYALGGFDNGGNIVNTVNQRRMASTLKG
jgi:hypothetical protein